MGQHFCIYQAFSHRYSQRGVFEYVSVGYDTWDIGFFFSAHTYWFYFDLRSNSCPRGVGVHMLCTHLVAGFPTGEEKKSRWGGDLDLGDRALMYY